jgi:hypothetical protein
MKSGSLNLLEPSGPVQACNGIALPYYFDLEGATLLQFNSNKLRSSKHHKANEEIMSLDQLVLQIQ